jgi:hypothetical protein
MKCYQPYIIKRDLHPAEYLVQLYSIIRHKELNPTIPIVLVTDHKSLSVFEENGLAQFYDEINTEIFEDFPYDNVSPVFTSFPKVWTISKLETPFVVQEIDLIYHKNMDELEPFHFGYLFKHLANSYPRPFEVSTPENFEWSNLNYFKTSFPIDTSFLYFNDEPFKQKYTDFYFKFVLNNLGEYTTIDSKFLEKNIKSNHTTKAKSYVLDEGINKFSEQFILGSVSDEFYNLRPDFKQAQLLPVFFDSEKFIGLSYDGVHPTELVNNVVYHLGSSKHCLNGDNRGCNTDGLTKYIIKSGEELLKNSLNGFEIYGNTYQLLMSKINQLN